MKMSTVNPASTRLPPRTEMCSLKQAIHPTSSTSKISKQLTTTTPVIVRGTPEHHVAATTGLFEDERAGDGSDSGARYNSCYHRFSSRAFGECTYMGEMIK